MIRFTLSCDQDHRFESWFASSDAFETLLKAGHVACVVCGSTTVEKSLMAPSVSPGRKKEASLTATKSPEEQALAAMRKHVEDNSEYVGMSFAKEARAMHDGDAPERAIYGEAKPEEAKSLIEDGVPVAPLPFMPKAKTN